MSIPLKKCAHPDCSFRFPEHYFADYCTKHSTPETDAAADAKADRLVPSGQHLINVLASLSGMPPQFE